MSLMLSFRAFCKISFVLTSFAREGAITHTTHKGDQWHSMQYTVNDHRDHGTTEDTHSVPDGCSRTDSTLWSWFR